MLRRLLAVSLIAVALAACGGNSPTESPSASPAATSPAPVASPSPAPVASPSPTPALPAIRVAACGAVALRAEPSLSGKLLARIAAGAKVRVVAEMTGEAYTVGACGAGGDTWLKINRVNGKKVRSLYGTPYVYAAAGLFQ